MRGRLEHARRVVAGMGKKKRQHLEVDPTQLAAIVERTRGTLSPEDFTTLKAAMDTLAFVTAESQAQGTSLERLLRLLFGAPTEKTDGVLRQAGQQSAGRPQGRAKDGAGAPGHGRHAAAAYTGARREKVAHAQLKSGDRCQGCLKGKVYPLQEPAVLVRMTGMAPLAATVWECERLRCNLCGEVSTAQAPEGVGAEKYDETAVAMTGLLKYGTGLPFHRIEKLQAGLGSRRAWASRCRPPLSGSWSRRVPGSCSPPSTSWSTRRPRLRCSTTMTPS